MLPYVMETLTSTASPCPHHWLLGQPAEGSIAAVCRRCGAQRCYPAYLEDQDGSVEIERRYSAVGVTTAAGGARPSSIALLVDRES
jgi:hypothetical protein